MILGDGGGKGSFRHGSQCEINDFTDKESRARYRLGRDFFLNFLLIFMSAISFATLDAHGNLSAQVLLYFRSH